jgi:hypothetical protein
VEVVDQQVTDRATGDVVAVDQLFDSQLPTPGRSPHRGRTIGRQDSLLDEEQIPVAVQAGGVAGLGPVGLDAVGQGDVSQAPTVVHEDPGELVERRMTVEDGEPGGGVTEHVEAGEPMGVVPVPESLQRLGREQSAEPDVTGSDHPEQQQLARSPSELGAAVGAPAKTRMDHQLRPRRASRVDS